jgi:RND family efflux transporter MFP subunit
VLAAAVAQGDLESFLLEVKAPFDGVVTERLVHPGALVGPGSAGPELLRLEQVSRLRLVIAVPEASAAGIAPGKSVRFRVPAHPGREFTAVVARIPRALDPKTRSMAVEADVNNPRNDLAPGMYAEVEWPSARARSLLVPLASVVITTERSFVIRVVGGKAEWVNVTTGATGGDLVEVFGPLARGDEVVKHATDEIRNRSRIAR